MKKRVRKEDGSYTEGAEETERYLIDKYFPEDEGNEEDIEQILREETRGNNDIKFTTEEIKKTIDTMENKYSATKDGLSNHWIKKLKSH